MSWYTDNPGLSAFRKIPKVDLHRHLEGSMRLETLMEIVKIYGITLPLRPDLRSLTQVQPGETLTSSNFLGKFQILRLFYRSPEVIARITREAIEDAAADGVVYLDLHFTPFALARYQGFALSEVMDWVAESARRTAAEQGIQVRLIASVNRHESPALAEEVARLAVERINDGIVGLDLAGNEADYPAGPFVSLFCQARAAGLAAVIHAGEWSGSANVRQAIEEIQADRIIHGIRVMQDPAVVELARSARIPFAVCLTSNVQTGVVGSLQDHPLLSMIAAGLPVTLNSDDPSVSQITLSDEYHAACDLLGLPRSALYECILAAGRAAFLPPPEKQKLLDRLEEGLQGIQ